MIISHLHKFIFIHIRKCAGTSITESLLPFLGQDDLVIGCTPQGELLENSGRKNGGLYKHSKAVEIKKLIGPSIWDSYFKFTFIRNPWDLLVSKYHWALKTSWDNENGYTSTIKGLDDFEGYVLSPLCNKINCIDFILLEQGDYNVDYIGRYETLDKDFSLLCKKLNLPKTKLKKINASLHTHYKNYYNPLTRELVAEWFEKDITEFNYSFNNQ